MSRSLLSLASVLLLCSLCSASFPTSPLIVRTELYATLGCDGDAVSSSYAIANFCHSYGDDDGGSTMTVVDADGARYVVYNDSNCEEDAMPLFTFETSGACVFGQSYTWPAEGTFVLQASYDNNDCEAPAGISLAFKQDECNTAFGGGQLWTATEDTLTVCNGCTATDDGDCVTVPFPNNECFSIGNASDPFSLLYAYNVEAGDGTGSGSSSGDGSGDDDEESGVRSLAPAAAAVVASAVAVMLALVR